MSGNVVRPAVNIYMAHLLVEPLNYHPYVPVSENWNRSQKPKTHTKTMYILRLTAKIYNFIEDLQCI